MSERLSNVADAATLIPLSRLREHSQRLAYDIDTIDWSNGPDRARFWFPEHLTPLFYTSYYEKLEPAERLAYNQLYGLATNEQFIFLEGEFLIKVVEELLKGDRKKGKLGADLTALLETFVVEEVKHTEMFRRLSRISDPARYSTNDYFFFQPGRGHLCMTRAVWKRPELFVAWIWMALALEEKTISYFQNFERYVREEGEEKICPLYRSVHRYHMLDEARHVQIDHHLIGHLYDTKPGWQRWLNRKLLAGTLRSYTQPRKASSNANIVRAMAEMFPHMAPWKDAMIKELRALRGDAKYQEAVYGRTSLPRLFALFDAYPEMHALKDVVPSYDPPIGCPGQPE